jgi:hypothetical protein
MLLHGFVGLKACMIFMWQPTRTTIEFVSMSIHPIPLFGLDDVNFILAFQAI